VDCVVLLMASAVDSSAFTWLMFLIDTIHSVATNTPQLITPEECANLRMANNESSWQLDLPMSDSDAPTFQSVLDALDSDPNLPPPVVLKVFWARSMGLVYLLRESNILSRKIWDATGNAKVDFGEEVRKMESKLGTWKNSFDTFHTFGDASISSCGNHETGKFMVIFYHTSFLLMHSPRPAIDALVSNAILNPSLDAFMDLPVLERWACSRSAEICRSHVEQAATFWLTTLEGGISIEDVVGVFYDRRITFLGVMAWDVMYAGAVASLLERFGGERMEDMRETFGVFRRALVGMGKVWNGSLMMLQLVLALRRGLGLLEFGEGLVK
ncbi:hypothetical protein HDU97_009561, partial [Phlyctochytrium planicorne]